MESIFSVITCDLPVWYEDIYTPNPNGVVPDTTITRITTVNHRLNNNNHCIDADNDNSNYLRVLCLIDELLFAFES